MLPAVWWTDCDEKMKCTCTGCSVRGYCKCNLEILGISLRPCPCPCPWPWQWMAMVPKIPQAGNAQKFRMPTPTLSLFIPPKYLIHLKSQMVSRARHEQSKDRLGKDQGQKVPQLQLVCLPASNTDRAAPLTAHSWANANDNAGVLMGCAHALPGGFCDGATSVCKV